MTDLFSMNDGSHPSRLDLDRALTGEAPLDGHEALLDAHRAEVRTTPLPPLDLDALRQRTLDPSSAPVEPDPTATQRGAEVIPLFGWRRVVPVLMAALALLFVATPRGPDDSGHRTKGSTAIEVYVQRGDGAQRVQAGETLAEGDRLRFATRADGHETVVLLSVDGAGTISLFYPEGVADPPVAVQAYERMLLPEAIQLDDAPGPETFVAVFSPADTAAAMELVRAASTRGGRAALAELARTDPGVALLTVDKAP